jgi:hypothetical protein
MPRETCAAETSVDQPFPSINLCQSAAISFSKCSPSCQPPRHETKRCFIELDKGLRNDILLGVAKLGDLVATISAATGEEPRSVQVLAMFLRKNRLIASTGRGRHAAEMGAGDAANLLIGIAAPGPPTKVAETVGIVRGATFGGSVLREHIEPREERPGDEFRETIYREAPQLPDLAGWHPSQPFGEALDTVIGRLVATAYDGALAAIRDDRNGLHSVAMVVQRSTAGFVASLIIHGRSLWTLHFNTFENLALGEEPPKLKTTETTLPPHVMTEVVRTLRRAPAERDPA